MKILTSEAVFKGHPDKICDQISDAILDECLKQDKNSRVAVETLIKNRLVVLAGEITTKAEINYAKVVAQVLKDLGYEDIYKYKLICEISRQSSDIALGVDADGAGDQGIMYGYATNETKELMPLPIVLARRVAVCMDTLSEQYSELFGRDGKCQVSVEYDDNDKPVRIATVVVSQQTKPFIPRELYTWYIETQCLAQVLPKHLVDKNTKILINPTGEFVKGGAYADSGLTGRKIICDTYGGIGRHGGGAFSGKDVSKVDRLGAYYARFVAKNIVASGVAKKCEVQVAYAIGVDKPVAINVDAFGTSPYTNAELTEAVKKIFNFKPKSMKQEIVNDAVSFRSLAEYGHVGRPELCVPWERINKAYLFKTLLYKLYGKKRFNS